jgi:hypothetical protein
MKAILLATVFTAIMASGLKAQQRTPPALPPGMKMTSEKAEGEIVKVYSMEDQGAAFRAYVVKYKDNEVVVSDALAMTSKKVGDKIQFHIFRSEAPLGAKKVSTLKFEVLGFGLSQK